MHKVHSLQSIPTQARRQLGLQNMKARALEVEACVKLTV